jgi:hypothetical protein
MALKHMQMKKRRQTNKLVGPCTYGSERRTQHASALPRRVGPWLMMDEAGL